MARPISQRFDTDIVLFPLHMETAINVLYACGIIQDILLGNDVLWNNYWRKIRTGYMLLSLQKDALGVLS